MKLINPDFVWQAQNLPDGITFSNGVVSGTPTIKGTYSSQVSVSNHLGIDTKNITIIVKNRPGTEKFSILQDGVEIDKVTIPELRAMVQDGTAQSKYNCTNTQIILPVRYPQLSYSGNIGVSCNVHSENIALNFCDFRDFELEDGTTTQGLILQFDKSLWLYYAPFDTGDSSADTPLNRWRYSNLRQWLNSSGLNWFTPAYNGDALTSNPEGYKSYADSGACGFLDLLHEDLVNILQPVKIQTQAFHDYDNENSPFDEPEYIDGVDVDITFDKVFIPSGQEMYLYISGYDMSGSRLGGNPQSGIEGLSWAYWRAKFGTQNAVYCLGEGGPSSLGYNGLRVTQNDGDDEPTITAAVPVTCYWGTSLSDPDRGSGASIIDYTYPQQHVACRSAKNDTYSKIWDIYRYTYDMSYDEFLSVYKYNIDDLYFEPSNALYVNPAPAFVIC